MIVQDVVPPIAAGPPAKTKGEVYEGLAFTFCKAGTLLLITGKYALPVISGAAALFYFLAYFHGQRDSRCVLRKPLLIGGFWSLVFLGWVLRPVWLPVVGQILQRLGGSGA